MNEEKRKQRAVRALDDYLALHHKRRTAERVAVLETALEFKKPFVLEELERKVLTGGFRVSKATVYNSMSLFIEAGLSRKVRSGGRAELWEMADPTVDNLKLRLVCTVCGKVRELKDAELARTLSLRRFSSFAPAFFELYVSGTCSRCRRARSRNAKK